MLKADLHCHSIYSEHPSEWFLQRLGAKESYTDPLLIYNRAITEGMDLVTITDHNRIDGVMLLKDKYPGKVITGVEATTYFPEDGCKIHILVYGFNHVQFETINHIRKDIYELRDYLKQEDLTHSVAHASYDVNGKLSKDHLQKLILLFDYFESINGGRNQTSNQNWLRILKNLNPDIIQDLYNRYHIEPFSQEPWIKGYTGGSDDHGALFIAKTFTAAEAENSRDFLKQIRQKKSLAEGRHNNYHSLAFTVYKIAWDFSRFTSDKKKYSLVNKLTEQIFERSNLELKDRIRLKTMKSMADIKGDQLKRSMTDLIEFLHNAQNLLIDQKLDIVYNKIANMADAFFMVFLDSLESDLKEMNLIKMVKNISGSLPGIFLLLPFFSTLGHMHKNRKLLPELTKDLNMQTETRKTRVLWFSDTINDLNGVSHTIKRMGKLASEEGREVLVVGCLEDNQITSDIPENFLNLPFIYRFPLPFYENYRIKIPSILLSLKLIQEFEPDKIIVSTPGPIGLLALLAAKIMQVECSGVYHTDFTLEAEHIISDESARNLVLDYERWFYNQFDEILVPTREYKKILDDRGMPDKRIRLFKRGIDTASFEPMPNRKQYLPKNLKYSNGITLLYAGRISKDKSLELLAQIYLNLEVSHPDLNLVIAGNGPFLSELKEILAECRNVVFLGAIPREELPRLYNAADFFVFPSVTDTFGMVILEAQACGLPVIVSNQGGPKEIILPEQTGFVVKDQMRTTWVRTIDKCLNLIKSNPVEYQKLRDESSRHAKQFGNWTEVLQDLFGNAIV